MNDTQDKTYLQALYEKVDATDEEWKGAVKEVARIDLLLVLIRMIEKKAGEVA